MPISTFRKTIVLIIAVPVVLWALAAPPRRAAALDVDADLVGYWKLQGDCLDHSGHNNHGIGHGVDLKAVGRDGKAGTAAGFGGADAWIEIKSSASLNLGAGPFTLSAWLWTEAETDAVGDIMNKFDPATRRGFNFAIIDNQYRYPANRRNVFFGMDNGRDGKWIDCGKCDNVGIWCLCVHKGRLYAGPYTRNNGSHLPENPQGHVYRWEGDTRWSDLGRLGRSSNVLCLASFNGQLHAGVSYDESEGGPSGKVYRYDEENKRWIDCGQLGKHMRAECMAVVNGKLYAGAYGGALRGEKNSIYCYAGGKEWKSCGDPWTLLSSMGVYRGHLYAGQADVLRLEKDGSWGRCGRPGGESCGQVWSFPVYQGNLYAGIFPPGHVYRYEGDAKWTDCGRLETNTQDNIQKEVMALAVYNGKMYSGLWPTGEVYRYDGGQTWSFSGALGRQGFGSTIKWTKQSTGDYPSIIWKSDRPDEQPPRWPHCYAGAPRVSRTPALAVYQGKLFAGTWNWEYDLPGHVYCLETGKCVTHDQEMPGGWKHLAAVKTADRLMLYIDGEEAAASAPFDPAAFDLTNDRPLSIGFGSHDYFKGKIGQVRIHKRALPPREIRVLFERHE